MTDTQSHAHICEISDIKSIGTHSDPQHLETEEKLRNHIIQHDINSCKRSISGDSIYICPWKGCNKYQSSIIKLEEHLRQHTQ
ncbi:unnamed protein product [Rhizophagus irregularis]|uniref:C2H2-type domain-containing protein n=2 Tax=Rhizophagus irregularis TaxID=588596 RepID=A0A015NE84_RHIIW|nr:hypothetical protein GLOIN_2v1587792 [Rhizophagus irregularis DAOM 181602=DAOM 197198]EXX77603.1 hypothetical protein RirG_022350 [Rhizophagus irregularis DAOM 197198w]POG73252.1 hypothetical protein GLOIN_2v1587792 [Rhizophagus irregularis DAOM 181602=DAOM 197198]CAB4399328.1 unnamed protein product [Rhizophagus irregularis]CAB5360831.1 unnamed protein product [Rhizophagus irregularis]|eukprot:XP_025180118.1 hypothetical protein GLOIN_2v1587792 [Rhizophagus irregularis DAOM 181602=DAOM 197198]